MVWSWGWGKDGEREGRGERGLRAALFGASKGQTKAWALQYQFWTAEGNMSLRMLNFPLRQKEAV